MQIPAAESVVWPATGAGAAALWLAGTAVLIGLAYAGVSVYWGLGGTALVDTVGGTLAKLGRERDAVVVAALWGAAALKLAAAVLPLVALRSAPARARRDRGGALTRGARRASWVAAVVLTVYGAVYTGGGLLVQAGVIHSSRSADHRAQAWHAYLWDPWFLVWGVLITAALVRSSGPAQTRG
jgi:hypothetical protein